MEFFLFVVLIESEAEARLVLGGIFCWMEGLEGWEWHDI